MAKRKTSVNLNELDDERRFVLVSFCSSVMSREEIAEKFCVSIDRVHEILDDERFDFGTIVESKPELMRFIVKLIRPFAVMPFELDDDRRFIFIRLWRKKMSLERIADELLISPQRVHQIDNDPRFDFETLVRSNPDLAKFAKRIAEKVNSRNESLDDYSNEAAIERLTVNVETIKKVAPAPSRESFELSSDVAARKKIARRMFRKNLAEAANVASNRLTLEKALDVLGDDAPRDAKTLDELLDRLTDSVL